MELSIEKIERQTRKMSRTRSGMLDSFDLTGLSDSDDDAGSTVVSRKRARPRSNRMTIRIPRFDVERNVGATATITPIAKCKQSLERADSKVSTRKNPYPKIRIPSFKLSPQAITECDSDNTSSNKDDDAIEIIGESNTGSNPFLDFPHRREDCQRFAFSKNPERYCRLCYCYVCDVPASECKEWYLSSNGSHCEARHSDSKSKLKRRSVQMRKHTLRPRKKLLPPHRLREPPEVATTMTSIRHATNPPSQSLPASANLSGTKNTKSPKRTLVHTQTSISAPDPSVPVRKNLRLRTEIQLPHRLRPPAGVVTGVASKKKQERTERPLFEDSSGKNLRLRNW